MTTTHNVDVIVKGKRAGFNLDGSPIGYATLISKGTAKGTWTVHADLYDANGNFVQPYCASRFPNPDAAGQHLASIVHNVLKGQQR